jgi:hypothetical protein
MKNLSIAVLAALSLLSFAGCKKKGGSDVSAKMAEFRDQMCKCTDKACADKVMESMTKWTQDNAKEGNKEAAKPTEEDMKKMTAISEDYSKCMQKVMMASAPPAAAPPAGDKPADPAAAPPAAPAAGDKPADPAAAPPAAPAAGDKPAAGSN